MTKDLAALKRGTRPVAAQRAADPNEIARRQFVRNLERQAWQEALDARTRARWAARQPAVAAAAARERRVLIGAFLLAVVVALAVLAAAVYVLVTLAVPIVLAVVLALLLSSAGGCGCVITVTHVCGH